MNEEKLSPEGFSRFCFFNFSDLFSELLSLFARTVVILAPKLNFQDLPIHRQIRLQLTEIDETLQGFFLKRPHQKITAVSKSQKLEFLPTCANFCKFVQICANLC